MSASEEKIHLEAPPSHPVVCSSHLRNAACQLVISSSHLDVSSRVSSSRGSSSRFVISFLLASIDSFVLQLVMSTVISSFRQSTGRVAHQLVAFFSGIFL